MADYESPVPKEQRGRLDLWITYVKFAIATRKLTAREDRLESDMRFYRRRANEEMAAADRAVTEAARERRIQLAGIFLERLRDLEIRSAFDWADERPVERV